MKKTAKASTPPAIHDSTPHERRAEAVEEAIRDRGWSHRLALELAATHAVGWRTIYRDREAVLGKLAAEEQADLPKRRAAFLADVRNLREEARAGGDMPAASRLLAMEGKVLGLDNAPLPTVEEDAGPIDTSLEAVLAATRRLRRRAEAGDSYVSAEKLLTREHAIIADIRARDEAAQDRDLANLTEDEKVATVAELMRGLPDVLRARVLAEIA